MERREFLKLCLAVWGATLLCEPFVETEAAEDDEARLKRVLKEKFGGREIRPSSKINLSVPIIAENGAVVPVKVSADMPMKVSLYVKKIYIFVDGNMNPYVGSVELSPKNGRAEVAMRIKMRKTSPVRAVIEMSDGSLYTTMKEVKVTRGGCGG